MPSPLLIRHHPLPCQRVGLCLRLAAPALHHAGLLLQLQAILCAFSTLRVRIAVLCLFWRISASSLSPAGCAAASVPPASSPPSAAANASKSSVRTQLMAPAPDQAAPGKRPGTPAGTPAAVAAASLLLSPPTAAAIFRRLCLREGLLGGISDGAQSGRLERQRRSAVLGRALREARQRRQQEAACSLQARLCTAPPLAQCCATPTLTGTAAAHCHRARRTMCRSKDNA